MTRKIFNIIIFTVAGLGCLLGLWFAVSFDDNKKDLYYEVINLKENNPELLAEYKAVTPESLPAFVEKNQAYASDFAASLKEEQLQKDILYTYITGLKDITEATFDQYKADFSVYSKSLFNKSDKAQEYTNGFNAVSNYKELQSYIKQLDAEYALTKQDFLLKKDYSRHLNMFLKRNNDITVVISESKKLHDLETLQSDVSSSTGEEKTLNVSVILVYVTFIIAIALMLFFAIIQIATNIKSSYKALLAIAGMIAVFFIGYALASPELSRSAIIMGHSVSEVRFIEAGMILFYVMFVGAIASIIISWLISKFKKV